MKRKRRKGAEAARSSQDQSNGPQLHPLAETGGHHKKKRGAYAFSADGVESWRMSNWEARGKTRRTNVTKRHLCDDACSFQVPLWGAGHAQVWPAEIAWDDGTTQFLLKQQRPALIFDLSGKPTHLVTGVDSVFFPCCNWSPANFAISRHAPCNWRLQFSRLGA